MDCHVTYDVYLFKWTLRVLKVRYFLTSLLHTGPSVPVKAGSAHTRKHPNAYHEPLAAMCDDTDVTWHAGVRLCSSALGQCHMPDDQRASVWLYGISKQLQCIKPSPHMGQHSIEENARVLSGRGVYIYVHTHTTGGSSVLASPFLLT